MGAPAPLLLFLFLSLPGSSSAGTYTHSGSPSPQTPSPSPMLAVQNSMLVWSKSSGTEDWPSIRPLITATVLLFSSLG